MRHAQIAAGGDAQHPAQRGDREAGLLSLDEPEHAHRVSSVSRAKKAAAFFRISRSSRRIRFSRRRRRARHARRWSGPRPRPASTSAWMTQRRSDSSAMPEIARDLAQRVARLTCEAHGLGPELGWVRWSPSWHVDSLSRGTMPRLSGVHGTGSTPARASDRACQPRCQPWRKHMVDVGPRQRRPWKSGSARSLEDRPLSQRRVLPSGGLGASRRPRLPPQARLWRMPSANTPAQKRSATRSCGGRCAWRRRTRRRGCRHTRRGRSRCRCRPAAA